MCVRESVCLWFGLDSCRFRMPLLHWCLFYFSLSSLSVSCTHTHTHSCFQAGLLSLETVCAISGNRRQASCANEESSHTHTPGHRAAKTDDERQKGKNTEEERETERLQMAFIPTTSTHTHTHSHYIRRLITADSSCV